MPETKLTPKAQAEKLIKKILAGKEVHDLFTENMRRQLTISGQPMEHWEEAFKIRIPVDNLTPQLCKELDIKLMDLNQEATFHHAAAQMKGGFIKRGADASYLGSFAALVEEFKARGGRLPGAATLETMAKIDNEDLDSAQSFADIEAKFWKNILDHLNTCRKLIENATINISVELKSQNHERMLDRLNSRIDGGYNG